MAVEEWNFIQINSHTSSSIRETPVQYTMSRTLGGILWDRVKTQGKYSQLILVFKYSYLTFTTALTKPKSFLLFTNLFLHKYKDRLLESRENSENGDTLISIYAHCSLLI